MQYSTVSLGYHQGFWSATAGVPQIWVDKKRKSEAGSKFRLAAVNITQIYKSASTESGLADGIGH